MRPVTAQRCGVLTLALAAVLLTACTPPGLPEPIAPTGAATTASSPPGAGTVVIGLDGSAGQIPGFNPYAIADYSPAAQAAAGLVLPSTFVLDANGVLAADPDVVDSAEITSTDPFTVTYVLDRAASWSDGTPITAEDFAYLRDELLVQPGTVGSAGYRLITDIRSRDAGKTVEVEFDEQFPGWQSLFSPLLPSHLMKDSPGGWSAALGSDLPISANRYRMTSYDPVTGQISLARNDKYWGTPPGPVAVVLRLGDPTDLLAAFTRGDVQALWFAPDAEMAAALQEAIPADRRTVVPAPASTQLIFNTTTGPTAEQNLREGVTAAITPTAVAGDLTGGWSDGGQAVISQVALPSEADGSAGGDAKAPVTTADPDAARRFLGQAGYTGDGLYLSRDGVLLRLTLGYPSGDPRLAAAARTVQRQLGASGIEVDLLPDASAALVQTRLAAGTIDLALLTVPRGSQDPVAAMSAFGCPLDSPLGLGSTVTSTAPTSTEPTSTEPTSAAPTGTEPTGTEQDSGDAGGGDGTAAATPTPGTTDPEAADSDAPQLRTGNLSGYCEPANQRVLTGAITGSLPVQDADPGLWADLPVLPIIQPAAVFAVSESLQPVLTGPHPGWVWTGPLAGLAQWPMS